MTQFFVSDGYDYGSEGECRISFRDDQQALQDGPWVACIVAVNRGLDRRVATIRGKTREGAIEKAKCYYEFQVAAAAEMNKRIAESSARRFSEYRSRNRLAAGGSEEKMVTKNRKRMTAAEIWKCIGGELLAWRSGHGPVHHTCERGITIDGTIRGQSTIAALARRVAERCPSGAFDYFSLRWEVTNDGRTNLWWEEIY